MTPVKLAVAIVGGGLAGNLLARQLRRAAPDLQIGLFERSTEPSFKVGESLVEVASNYLLRRLGLSSYLYDRHYPKNGLRFFFDGPARDFELHEMSEIGSDGLPFLPAFQIDRARFESDLLAMNAEDEVLVRTGVEVRDLELGRDGALHRFSTSDGRNRSEYEARWVVDASGRSRMIARLLDLAVPEPGLHNAAIWGRFEGVTDVDAVEPAVFRERVRHSARRLSTLHFVYPDYWIWFIPLRDGVTSVGVVGDKSVFRPHHRTQEGFVEFLREHRAVGSLLSEAKPIDLGSLSNLAYTTRRFFSPDRWGLTGEAASFTDPFYSPGGDFIALENDFLSDLIARDLAGASQEALDARCDLYDRFMAFRQEATMCLYRDQYALLGSWDTCKLKWDLDVGCYYNLWLASYMCDRHLDTAWLETQLAQKPYILRALANFSDLYRKVAATLSERGQYFRNNRGLYNSGRECLHFMTEIGVARSDALELQRTGEIFNAVRDRALDLLDDVAAPAAREPMPLPRFMGRRPL